MKKSKVTKLKVRWRPRKVIAYITFVIISGLCLGSVIMYDFSQYTRKDVWIKTCLLSIVLLILISTLIYFFIAAQAKKKVYHININQKICNANNRTINYERVYHSQTLLQKIFGLVSIELENERESIVLKDISENILEYL